MSSVYLQKLKKLEFLSTQGKVETLFNLSLNLMISLI